MQSSKETKTVPKSAATKKRRRQTTSAALAAAAKKERRTAGGGKGKRGRAIGGPRHLFPALRKTPGLGVAISVGENAEGSLDFVEAFGEWPSPTDAKRASSGKKSTSRRPRLNKRVCVAMAAAGHEVRAKLMLKLLDGPATYRALKRMTKLEAGPLYHHINQLRLAGLILPKQRDLYELTRGGRNLILVMMVLDRAVHDRRRRPISMGAD